MAADTNNEIVKLDDTDVKILKNHGIFYLWAVKKWTG